MLGLVVSSVVFGAIHSNLVAFLPLTLFAVLLVMLYESTDTLLAPIVAHSLFNAIAFLGIIINQS
jgi:membrane protease YdiL (CAAX protease family)